ncbi:MAG: hypothetical protein ABFS30_10245, partial [Pseudomonadota bacterium]
MAGDLETRVVISLVDRATPGVKQVEGSVKNLGVTVRQSGKSLNDAFRTLNIRPFKAVQNEIRQVEVAYKRLAASGKLSSRELARAQSQVTARVAALKSELGTVGQSVQNLRLKLLGAAAAFAGAFTFTKSIVEAGVAMQGFGNALESATGSQEAAAESMRFIRAEAERLGLNLQSVIPSFTKLAASAKGTALEGQATRDIFTAV